MEKTICGKPLDSLGKGYTEKVSAIKCTSCDGAGYRAVRGVRLPTGVIEVCPTCSGDGLKYHPCKYCNGTGEYRNPHTRVSGPCYRCNGSGKFYPYDKFNTWGAPLVPHTDKPGQPCPTCKGTKTVEQVTDGSLCYVVCSKCGGVGETKMWNPVIPRGLVNL